MELEMEVDNPEVPKEQQEKMQEQPQGEVSKAAAPETVESVPVSETVLSTPHEVARPNANWHIHKGPNFISYVHIGTEAIQIDRYLKITKNEVQVVLEGKKLDFPLTLTSFDDVSSALKELEALVPSPGTGHEGRRDFKCSHFLQPINQARSNKLPPRCLACANRKRAIAKGKRRAEAAKFKRLQLAQVKRKETKSLRQKVKCRDKKINSLEEKLKTLQGLYDALEKAQVIEYVCTLPEKWRFAVLACFEAAKAKKPCGRRYTNQWIYECALLRIKSLALYKKMLRDNFLPLPSLRTIQRYMKKLKPSYGFQENVFNLLKEKAEHIALDERHGKYINEHYLKTFDKKKVDLTVSIVFLTGSLLVDEITLAEGVHYDKITLRVKGLVFLAQYTPENQKDAPADHALTFMFQSFKGQYFQSIGVFLTKGAAKGPELAKLIIEAIGLLENSGFYVDAVVTDAHPCNRNMWTEFGLRKKHFEKEGPSRKKNEKNKEFDEEDENEENFDYELLDIENLILGQNKKKAQTQEDKQPKKNTQPKKKTDQRTPAEESGKFETSCEHPIDKNRRLWFFSDFPHLVKSVKQKIVNAEEIVTPDGTVKLSHWAIVCCQDEKRGIKVAPKLGKQHFQTESYATMSVKNAFSFFSEQVATAMEHYKSIGIPGMQDCGPSVAFIRRMNVLIDAMNSNTRRHGLKCDDEFGEDDEDSQPPVCPECQKTHAENTPRRRKSSRKVLEDFLEYLERWEKDPNLKRDQRLTASAAYGLRVSLTSALELSTYLHDNLGFEYLMTRRVNQDALEVI
ncbi:uncharacterized protein LOC117646214 [Thrips palmi]|uniref:Uncharacterized protein LOC117646214 n=1 Tax=Thrips palmi TaxID=161013 RepID=A0A6P8Z7R6_THRPL|nr:uncharacterized protein LOC117646214 [Thrips palmi]